MGRLHFEDDRLLNRRSVHQSCLVSTDRALALNLSFRPQFGTAVFQLAVEF